MTDDGSAGAPTRLVLAELVDAMTAVNRVGNNLNQLARERKPAPPAGRPPRTSSATRAALSEIPSQLSTDVRELQ